MGVDTALDQRSIWGAGNPPRFKSMKLVAKQKKETLTNTHERKQLNTGIFTTVATSSWTVLYEEFSRSVTLGWILYVLCTVWQHISTCWLQNSGEETDDNYKLKSG